MVATPSFRSCFQDAATAQPSLQRAYCFDKDSGKKEPREWISSDESIAKLQHRTPRDG